ncbi:MAG TPA: hypothetical protein VGP62_22840 [Bryobacteraceae bacterium]|nr:hypothetical protein [Bryobacteraceae bacterium]
MVPVSGTQYGGRYRVVYFPGHLVRKDVVVSTRWDFTESEQIPVKDND